MMTEASIVYGGSPEPEASNGEAELRRQLFPVGRDGKTGIAPETVVCDAHAKALLDREDGKPDAWEVNVFGDDGAQEVELPMFPYGLSDLDPYYGQYKYWEELVRPLEAMLGRTGLTILVAKG